MNHLHRMNQAQKFFHYDLNLNILKLFLQTSLAENETYYFDRDVNTLSFRSSGPTGKYSKAGFIS